MTFTKEQLEEIRAAGTPEALQAYAQEHGVMLTDEQAALNYSRFHSKEGELSLEELENAAAGGDCWSGYRVRCYTKTPCQWCGNHYGFYNDKLGNATKRMSIKCEQCGHLYDAWKWNVQKA